jgi:hypothetical protein
MSSYFAAVKAHLQDLNLDIQEEDVEEELVVVSDDERGIHQLILDCEEPILILEQAIMPVPQDPKDLYRRLLEMNRTLIHGAFALDEAAETVLFRDTLRLDTLDRAEIEGTINALGLALAENASELLSYSAKQAD